MVEENLKKIINEFLDGELPKEKENYLFTALGNNDEAREYFKKINSIKMAVLQTKEEFPSELEESIFTKLKNSKSKPVFSILSKNRFSFITYSLIIILFATGYFFFNEYNYQKTELELAKKQLKQQEELINVVMTNQLPPVTVEPEFENEIVVQATTL